MQLKGLKGQVTSSDTPRDFGLQKEENCSLKGGDPRGGGSKPSQLPFKEERKVSSSSLCIYFTEPDI